MAANPLPPGWLDELSELLAIPSVSADPEHAADVSRAAEWVAGKIRSLGGNADVREGGRLVVGEISGPPGAPTVLVYGHYDVQPPDPLELWHSDPFEAEVRGEWLYARGVADDKGQLWMQLQAIEALVGEGTPPVSFRIVCDGEEETGGSAIARFLSGDLGPADACVVFDGWMKRRNTPELVVAGRGLVALDLEVRTGERDLHSGHYGGTALNAIHALAQALVALLPHDGRLPAPLRAGVTPPSDDELTGWVGLPPGGEELERVGAVPLDPKAADEFYLRAFTEPSVDVTGITGGKPALRNTTIVSRASAGVTIRVAPGQSPEAVATAAEQILRDALPAGAALDVQVDVTPPALLPRDTDALRLAREAFRRVFGTMPPLVRAGGTLPILAALARRQIPTVMAGFALPDSHTHSPNERMLLETFPLGVAAARELYRALGGLSKLPPRDKRARPRSGPPQETDAAPRHRIRPSFSDEEEAHVYVRIARFEGGDLAEADQAVARVRQQMQSERPAGLEGAKRLLMLIDRQNGRGMGLTFYDTEEDMRRGDEALNAMNPQGDARRTSVEMYEVGIDQEF